MTDLEAENKKVKSVVKNIKDNNSATVDDIRKLLVLIKTSHNKVKRLHDRNIKLAGKNRQVLKQNQELLKALRNQTTKNKQLMQGIDNRMKSGFEQNQERLDIMRIENTSLLSKLKELMENLTNRKIVRKSYSAPPVPPRPKPRFY